MPFNNASIQAAAKLLLVDGHAYAYRSFFAIRELSAPDGSPTNAIYGFIKALDKLRREINPTHCAVIWDGGLDEGRMKLLPTYKAHRPEMPDLLRQQMDGMAEYLVASGIETIRRDGQEADDIIGGLALRAAEEGAQVVIASPDKDFMQLVNDRIAIVNPNDKSGALWGSAEVQNKTGVLPSQIVDWLSLTGDSVDGIKGVEGVGPKTATKLLNQFQTIDSLYIRLSEVVPERIADRLNSAKETVMRNRALVALKHEFAGDITLSRLRLNEPTVVDLRDLFTRWGFNSFLVALESQPLFRL